MIKNEVTFQSPDFKPRQKMVLNDAGKIAYQCWLNIPELFPDVVLHEHIVMPDHVYGIIELKRVDQIQDQNTNNAGTRHVVSLPDNIGMSVGTSHVMSLHCREKFSFSCYFSILHEPESEKRKYIAGLIFETNMALTYYRILLK